MKEPATTLPPMANENYAAFVEFEEENAGVREEGGAPRSRDTSPRFFSARKKKGEATGATSDDEREWSRASEKLQI